MVKEKSQGNMPEATKKTGFWKPFSDGWFSYLVCSVCGHKEWSAQNECPQCKSRMSTETDK